MHQYAAIADGVIVQALDLEIIDLGRDLLGCGKWDVALSLTTGEEKSASPLFCPSCVSQVPLLWVALSLYPDHQLALGAIPANVSYAE
jgi:hypothetical protein